MTIDDILSEIKLEITGGVLKLEIPDETLKAVVYKALREVQRYIDETRIMTIPYSKCIDLSGSKVSSVSRIYRAEGYLGEQETASDVFMVDPMWAAQWQILCGGGDMYNLTAWVQNYGAWNTMLQLRNTISTDLDFFQDHSENKLYINTALDKPTLITVEYVPIFENVDDIKSDYWKDILVRLSIALTKVTLGRIRTRFTQSNALWAQDGERLLEEGNNELTNLRDTLRVNSQLLYPKD